MSLGQYPSGTWKQLTMNSRAPISRVLPQIVILVGVEQWHCSATKLNDKFKVGCLEAVRRPSGCSQTAAPPVRRPTTFRCVLQFWLEWWRATRKPMSLADSLDSFVQVHRRKFQTCCSKRNQTQISLSSKLITCHLLLISFEKKVRNFRMRTWTKQLPGICEWHWFPRTSSTSTPNIERFPVVESAVSLSNSLPLTAWQLPVEFGSQTACRLLLFCFALCYSTRTQRETKQKRTLSCVRTDFH